MDNNVLTVGRPSSQLPLMFIKLVSTVCVRCAYG